MWMELWLPSTAQHLHFRGPRDCCGIQAALVPKTSQGIWRVFFCLFLKLNLFLGSIQANGFHCYIFTHIYHYILLSPKSPLFPSSCLAGSLPSNNSPFCFHVKYILLIYFPLPSASLWRGEWKKWMLNALSVLTILITIQKQVFVDIIMFVFYFPFGKNMLCGGHVSCSPLPHTCPKGIINIWWINKTSGVHSCLPKAHPPFSHQFYLLHQVNNTAVGIKRKSSLYSRHLFIASVDAKTQTHVTWFCI